MNEQLLRILACPACKQPINKVGVRFKCSHSKCNAEFPIINGKPVLLNGRNSVFSAKSVVEQSRDDSQSRWIQTLLHTVIPSITHNWAGPRNFTKLAALLRRRKKSPVVLVIGAGEMGVGLEELAKLRNIQVIETDICFGPRTELIADGHDLPFLDQSFDAVVVQAVLEHVLDPFRCVSEAHRVLKEDGLIYAETPFMYPVHLGSYDFTRFTLSGHRRLLRRFARIDDGVASGPGQGLAVSLRSFVLSLSSSILIQGFATMILPFFTFWLKYFDYFLIARPHAADFASTLFFLGEKRNGCVSDEQIINHHWSKQRLNSTHGHLA